MGSAEVEDAETSAFWWMTPPYKLATFGWLGLDLIFFDAGSS
jgi:hypothetical protein